MEEKKIHVLEVNINDIGQGGAWAFIKNAMNAKSDTEVIFDFFTLEPFENEENVQFVESHGGKVIVRHTLNRWIRQIKTYFGLKSVIKNNRQYDIVHIHSDLAFKMLIEGLAAKHSGVKHIIFHSHCTGVDGDHRTIKSIAHHFCRLFLGGIGTDFFACSLKAGKWMYTPKVFEKVKVINNAVDCKKFSYNIETRKLYRENLGVSDSTVVIGHVGRFMYQKNHEFLIDIFEQYHQLNPDSALLLIGEGELMDAVKSQVAKCGLDESVVFLGVTSEVAQYMQAMDLFLLPSRFEGLPVVGIEAQAAGLPCLMSSEITKETDLFGLIDFMDLNDFTKLWAEKISSKLDGFSRKDTYTEMVESGFDISVNNEQLKDVYMRIDKK